MSIARRRGEGAIESMSSIKDGSLMRESHFDCTLSKIKIEKAQRSGDILRFHRVTPVPRKLPNSPSHTYLKLLEVNYTLADLEPSQHGSANHYVLSGGSECRCIRSEALPQIRLNRGLPSWRRRCHRQRSPECSRGTQSRCRRCAHAKRGHDRIFRWVSISFCAPRFNSSS